MGGAGAGLGTSLSYWLLLLVVVGVMLLHPKIRSYQIWQPTTFRLELLTEALRLGLPIGLQIFAEVAIFAVVGLLMSKFSSQVIAAHQSAMNFTTLLYVFPLSISTTMPITIAYEVGAKRYKDARESFGVRLPPSMVVIPILFL